MSDRVGLKPKDNAAKKFSSLNLNQTYKGTKVEQKASTGVPRHGLQSLGKVASSRRMPPPANLPSLKSENLGNDPTVALVPSGGGGWGSGKDKEANATTTTNKTASQGQATAAQPQQSQPSKGTDTSQKETTTQQTNAGQTTSTNQTSATTKTWASGSPSGAGGQERTSYPHQSQYFNREFPTLGGGNSKDKLPEERASHQPYGQPPRNMHEPPWMDKSGSGAPPPKSSFAMYNGAPYPGPPHRGGYGQQAYHRDSHPVNNHSQDFPYMGQSRPPNYAIHPAANQRGHPGSRGAGPMSVKHAIKLEDSPSGYVRPSIVNEDEIRAMDSGDVEDGGWAGAQEEIDYSVKLNFDDDEPPSPVGDDGQTSRRENRQAVPASEALHQDEKVVNGDANNRTQVDGKRPSGSRRQAWSVPAQGHNNFQPQWNDPVKQGQYAQRQWAGHFPPQQRNAYPMGQPPPGHQNPPGGRPPPPQDQSRTGPTSANKPASERNAAIEQARQRKLMEEEERKKQQEAASREKLRLLDARTRPIHIQTHETSAREPAGPRSPVSPAGSDAPVRRIMRRKDSGSIGDDDGSSVKSVESVGKEEKKIIPENKNQMNRSREPRKTSSGELEDERKSPALKKNDSDEKNDYRKNDKIEQKSSITKDTKETEKPKTTQDSQRQRRDENRETVKIPTSDRRDNKKHPEDQEKRPERKSSESRPRSDEAFGRKSHQETDEFYDKADHEGRKENLERRGNRLSSKSDRGSSESVRSRDSTEKRRDDRRRPEDIKRKRDDFEKNEKDHGNRDRPTNRDRLPSRGRGTVTVKSHLRGHPKSYSHGRGDRTTTQRHSRTRNESNDYADDEIKTGADDEKSQVNVKTGERKFTEGDRRKPDSDRRARDDDRRQQDGKQHYNTDKRYREGDRRNVEREKREGDDVKQQTSDRRRKDYQTSQFYDSSKRRETRDTRDDRPPRKGGQLPRTSSSRGPVDRAERFRDKTKNSGGFGVPPSKEQSKKSDNEGKSKDETWDKTKTLPNTSGSQKPIKKESSSANEGKASTPVPPPPANSWFVSESKDTAKDAETEEALAPLQKTATEVKVDKPATTEDSDKGKKAVEKEEESRASAVIVKKQVDYKEDKPAWKSSQYESKTREGTVLNKDGKDQQNFKSYSNDTKVEKRRETEGYGESRRRQDGKFDDGRSRQREQPKRNDTRKAPVEANSENWEEDANSRVEEQKSIHNRDGARQTDRTQDQSERRNNASYRDRREQEKSSQRNRSERNRTDRERTDRRDQRDYRREGGRHNYTEQREPSDRRDRVDRRDRQDQGDRVDRRDRTNQADRQDRRDRTDQADRQDRRDRTDQGDRQDRRDRTDQRDRREQNERADQRGKIKTGDNETNSDKPRKTDFKGDEQTKNIHPNEDANKESKITEKCSEDLSATKKQDRFTMGTVSPVERRRYNDSRRGDLAGRRGGRGGTRAMRGRGRGRGASSAKPVGRDSTTTTKDDDENDSDDYHSAHSSVDSDETDSEEVFDKPDERHKDDRRPTRAYYSSSRSRGSYSSRGRARGSSQLTRNTRKVPEKPPRFQRQEARSGSRGRGRNTRGGFPSKENWDDNLSKIKDGRNSDEGPLPKKRPTDPSYSNDKDNDGSSRGRKTTRGGHSGNRNSFLAKKQQEVVEGSSRKGGGHFGAKSTIPAALTTHGRRAKNEPASADGDESLEPPKKNPRRTEPQKMGIEHIDLSNIAGFIDIDDIAQPANEFEPASPQSDFVEVKSKRTQKEQRERAREEEEKKRRETEKMIQDALSKPKGNKSSQNKQHSASKPPRFSRNTSGLSNVVSTLPEGGTPPRGATPVASPENSTITALPQANVEQKRVSPLMLEKPSSPPPPPMFNAWTKPLSITPAKPPNETSVNLSRVCQPDPLAVGSGKPQRAGGAHPKAEEPGLQIQLNLPYTFQAIPGERDIDSQSSESRMFSRVDDRDGGEPDVSRSLKKTSDNVGEQTESKKTSSTQSADSNAQKGKSKINTESVKTTEPTVNDKNSENDKRQAGANNWKSSRPPRFEKNVPGKRNTDGRKLKADTKDINGEPKSQHHTEKPKERNDDRPRSNSRPRDVNKTQKAKAPVKNAKNQNSDENKDPNIERSLQEKTENGKPQQNVNKRDSVELDVHSMSESLLDEPPLGVHMVETSKAGPGSASVVKMKSEDDLKIDFEMQEKMEAAKLAWEHMGSPWASSVTDDESSESAEVSVVDQIPITSPKPEESSEPLATTPRLKKPIPPEQQNVCKVKPQQQQQPVKPKPVTSEVSEAVTSRPVLESPAQASYPVHQAAIFTSKPPSQGYTFSFEQQELVPISHQYVQTDMSSIQQHASPIRPQTLHTASQSPPQRAATYPQGQSASMPSPLSHQPLVQNSYRSLLPGTAALYQTNTYASNQYFPISMVRPAAPAQFPPTINDDMNNSIYTVQARKAQNPSHGYETAVPATQQVFLPVEQQRFSEYVQPQRPHPVGFYSDNTSQTNLAGLPGHVAKSVAFPPGDKQPQPQRDSRTPSGRQEQQYTQPAQSEMSKHVHAKPFQPPSSSPSASGAHQIPPANVRQVPTVPGQTNVAHGYHVNNAVLPMHVPSASAFEGSVSSSGRTGTSPIASQAHGLPVSRLGYHQFPTAVGSFQRQVQVPVQQLPPSTYPAGIAYRAQVPNYPAPTSVANQPGVLVHKPAPIMRQLVAAGRGAPVPHRMPEPIQRPSKTGFHLGNLKEKQLNQPQRLKAVHQTAARRGFNPVGAAPPQMPAYQFQPVPRPQQPTQPQQQQQQQQQMFRSQQHQQMLSQVQQFFAEDKEIEHQRKQKQATQKREPVSTTTSSDGDTTTTSQQVTEDKRKQQPKQEMKQQETEPTSSTKDEQQKKQRQQIPENRRGIRTAQIPPQRNPNRPQNRPKPSGPKQEPVQQLSAVPTPKSETKKVQPRLDANTEHV